MAYENTHLFVAEQIRLCIEQQDLKNILDLNRNFYLLGAIFPDTFSFSDSKEIQSISKQLHGGDGTPTNRPIFQALDAIKQQPDPQALAFVCGFSTHLALDITVHPVIYYYSRFKADGSQEEQKRSSYLHWHYETYLDHRFNSQCYLEGLVTIETARALRISSFLDIQEPEFLKALARQISYFSSNRSRLYYHWYRLKHQMGCLERKYLAGHYANLELDRKRLPELLSYRDPVTGERKKNTLEDLMQSSIEKGQEMVQAAYAYHLGDIDKNACQKVIDGSNLDTGRVGILSSDIRYSI
jgi:hypothetical protein